MYGPEWKEKVSPPEPSPSVSSTTSQATPIQAASEVPDQPHPPQSKIDGTTTTQSSPTQDNIASTSTPQPSPPEDAAGSISATGQPPAVEDSSPIDPAVRFAQCKDQGNSLVKQV